MKEVQLGIRAKSFSVVLVLSILTTPLSGCAGPHTEFTVSPSQGATVEFEFLRLEIPPNAVSGDERGIISTVDGPPELVSDLGAVEKVALETSYRFVGDVYDVELGSPLDEPVTVALDYKEIPAGFTEDNLYVVQYVDGHWYPVPTDADPASQTVTAQVSHFSFLTVCVALGVITLAGAGAMIISLLTQPAFIGTAHKYLTPTAANIRDAVSGGRFVVDTAGLTLRVQGLTMTGEERARLQRPKTGEEMMNDPVGMCEDFANLFGSLLIAAEYPVRAVGGNATYRVAGEVISGGHAWIEVVIGDTVYYVDTFNPQDTMLVPVADARNRFELRPGRMWGKTVDNDVISTRDYDSLWPLMGEWEVTRTSLSVDHEIPDIMLNRVIPKDGTWELSRTDDGTLAWDFDGRTTWFNPQGQDISTGQPIFMEGEGSTSLSTHGSGGTYMASLPTFLDLLMRFASSETKKVKDISVNYEDTLELRIIDGKTATIEIMTDVGGTYTSVRERTDSSGGTEEYEIQDSFSDTVIVTYEAVKKE